MLPPPPMLLGLTLALWGWQTGFGWLGVVMGAVLEAARWTKARWELELSDFQQLWTITVLLFLGVFAYAFASQEGMSAMTAFFGADNFTQRSRAMETAARSVLGFLQWLPLVAYPMTAAQAFSAHATLPARLFLNLRRRPLPAAAQLGVSRRGIHCGYPYFALCLLATSAANEQRFWFYLALCPLMAYALWPARSPRFRPAVWVGVIALTGVLGLGLTLGLREFQALANHLQTLWLTAPSGRGRDYKESRTTIGQMHRTKGSSRIVLRVAVPEGRPGTPLLRETTFTVYRGETWQSAGARRDFGLVYPETNETSWVFLPAPSTNEVIITAFLPGGRGLLACPHGLTRMDDLPVFDLRTNHVNTLRVDIGPGLVVYRAQSGQTATVDSPPDPMYDLDIPPLEQPALERIARELRLDELPPAQRVRAIESFFHGRFEYSLYQDLRVQYTNSAVPTPLAWFLTRSRKGHCEYFATATTLLLRQTGIPARYTVGWSVQESAGPGRYVVRGRHAHAWCIYYDEAAGLWRELDTTPGTWFAQEARERSLLEPLQDAFSWLYLQYSRLRWGQGHLREYLFYLLMAVVVLLAARLAWEARKRRRRAAAAQPARHPPPGADSEFYLIERRLAQMGLPRLPSAPVRAWLEQIAAQLPRGLPPLPPILELHYRLRFDPRGLSAGERNALRELVQAWLASADRAQG